MFLFILLGILLQGSLALNGLNSANMKIYYLFSGTPGQTSGNFIPRDTEALYFDACPSYGAGTVHQTEMLARYNNTGNPTWWPVTGTTCGAPNTTYQNDHNAAHYLQQAWDSTTGTSSNYGFQFTVQNLDPAFTCATIVNYTSSGTYGKPFGFTMGWAKDHDMKRASTVPNACPGAANSNTPNDFPSADTYGAGMPSDSQSKAGVFFTFDWTRACNEANATAATWLHAHEGANGAFQRSSTWADGITNSTMQRQNIVPLILRTDEIVVRVEALLGGSNDQIRVIVNDQIAMYTELGSLSGSISNVQYFMIGAQGCGPEILISKVTTFRDAYSCMRNTCRARLGEPNYGIATCAEVSTSQVNCSCNDGYAYANQNNGAAPSIYQTIDALVGGEDSNENIWSNCSRINMTYYCTNVAPNGTCTDGAAANTRNEICFPGYSLDSTYTNTTKTYTGRVTATRCRALNMCALLGGVTNGQCLFNTPNQRTLQCNNGYSTDNTAAGVNQTITGNVVGPTSCAPFDLCAQLSAGVANSVCVWGGVGANYMRRVITCDVGYSFDATATNTSLTLMDYSTFTEGCTVALDMCGNYSATLINEVCTSSGPGQRTITCVDGYSSTTDSTGINVSYVNSIDPHTHCSNELDMCATYSTNAQLASSHQTCTPNGLNSRILTCMAGYSRTNVSTNNFNISVVLNGSGPIAVNCSVLDMCIAYSPVGSIANGSCAFLEFNKRTITCDDGYSSDTNSDTLGFIKTYTGTAAHLNCTYEVHMCAVYSPIITNGACYEAGVNTRNITCNEGYTSNGTLEGVSSIVVGNATAPTCSLIDNCVIYSPAASLYEADCTSGLGWRNIVCRLGYSSSNLLAGITQNITTGFPNGSDPAVNCSVVLDMCGNYSSTTLHETCANGVPGERIITCTPGYSTNLVPEGTVVSYMNTSTHAPCIEVLDMCQYSPNGSIAHASCTFNGVPNERIITCFTGYSVDNSSTTLQLVRLIPGPQLAGTITPCYPTDMCAVYSPPNSIDHGTCTNIDINVRTITCDLGYSANTNPDFSGTVLNYTGTTAHVNCSNVIPMCEIYSPTAQIANGTCINAGPNTRIIACFDGYTSNGTLQGINQTIVGNGTYKNCSEIGMCTAYSPPASIDHGTCVSGVNTRTITCDAGYSTNSSTLGTVVAYVGIVAHVNCSVVLNMCTNYSATLANETCVNGNPGDRIILCNPGYSTNASKQGVNITYNNTIVAHTHCNTVLDMCVEYSPNSSLVNATCYFGGVPNQRTIVCATGYSATNDTADLQITRVIIGSGGIGTFAPCTPTDMCALYSPAGSIANGTCSMVSPNVRRITCDAGYSANGNTDLTGVAISYTGNQAHANCTFILPMCEIYSPNAQIDNGTCANGIVNQRIITCADGYSSDGTVAGVTQVLYGADAYSNCSLLGMCFTYSPPDSILHGTCVNGGPNQRIITCDAGYSINSSTTGNVNLYIGTGAHINCSVVLDMCGNYSGVLRNETCTNGNPGDRIIHCFNGYSSNGSLTGVNVSYINSIAPHAPCLTIVDMCLWSTNATMVGSMCYFNPAFPNTRTIVCDAGYAVANSTTNPQLNQTIVGSGGYQTCYRADMCILYSPVGSIANGTCAFTTLNSRTVTCDAGYSINSNNDASGLVQTLSGTAPHANCTFIVNMCGTYSATVINGTCADTGVNQRTITCNAGYSSDGTVAGITQVITGPGGYNPCGVLNMCTAYSPAATISNGSCAFNPSAPNQRIITCQPGGTSNGAIAGITQVLIGTTAHLNCSMELDMCLYSPNPVNATCAHGYNVRYIRCNDGYSTDQSTLGITQTIFGTGSVQDCNVLDMCTAYFTGAQTINAYCNFTAINERTITCLNGYAVGPAYPTDLTDHVVGNGTSKLCNYIFDMCLFPPQIITNGNCTSPAVNTRHIMCDDGYSTNGTVAGTETYLTGTANNNVNCSVMNMCLWRTLLHADCNASAINERTYTCHPGYFFGSGDDTVQVITGREPSSALDCNTTLPMCTVYSPPAKLIHANCTSTGPGVRTIQCDDGYTSNGYINGTVQHINGTGEHINCTIPLNMCLYSPNNATNNPHGACVFDSGRIAYRTINCDPGYAFDNITLAPTTTREFWGPTNFTPVCGLIDMCAVYSPTAGTATSNTTCLWNSSYPNRRYLTCKLGYSQDGSTSNLTWLVLGTAAHTECPVQIGMCAYDPSPPNATCISSGLNERTIVCNPGYAGNNSVGSVTRVFQNQSYPVDWKNCTAMSMCLYSPNTTLINGTCYDAGINRRFILCNTGYSINSTVEGIQQNLTGYAAYSNCTTQVPMCLYQLWFEHGTCYNYSLNTRQVICNAGYSTDNTDAGITQFVVGPGLPTNCTKLDMCVAYKPNASIANGDCVSPNINEAIVLCDPGYGWENSTAGPNRTYVGKTNVLAALPCLPLNMCAIYSPLVRNGTCNNSAINQRTITCNAGYSSNASVPGIVQIINGQAAHHDCLDVLLMCKNYSYFSNTIPNGTCTDIALNTRYIICNNGYAHTNVTAPAGTERNITGPGALSTRFGGCLFQDMCVYSNALQGGDGLLNATCATGFYTRTITCFAGYSSNATTAGTVQRLPGITPHINCSFTLDMCLYTPVYQQPGGQFPQMTCSSLAVNTRLIRCNDGYSINNTIPGIWQTIIGTTAPANCTTLDMCAAWSPTINSTSMASCVFNASTPNQRVVTCQPGYSSNGTIAGITQVLYGNVSHVECYTFDMCQYNIPRNHTASCVNIGVNTRLVTCELGYGINGTFAGASQVIVGTAPNADCYDIDECFLLGCGSQNVSNATCVNGLNQRTCTCNLGFAYDGFQNTRTLTFIGNNNTYAVGCQDIPECIRYGCTDTTNCTEPTPNTRLCTCAPGKSRQFEKELRFLTLIGNATDSRMCDKQIDMCTYSGCGGNSTCISTSLNTRTCSCTPGVSRATPNFTANGIDRYTLIGDDNTQAGYGACQTDIDECDLYGCYNENFTNVNATCEPQTQLNVRVCRCPVGWQPVNGTQVPSRTDALPGMRTFDGCTNISMCARFGCYSTVTTDTNLWNETTSCENVRYINESYSETVNVRTCTCRPGYENPNSGVGLEGGVAFGLCVGIDECAVYSCGNASACEDGINERRCYCPFGTKNVTSFDSEVVVGNGTTSLICSDDDECEMFGCFDNRTKQQRTCRNEIGYRVCECPEGLIGTLQLGGDEYNATFPGCFNQITVSDVHSLGYTLEEGTYTDWKFAFEYDLTGDGQTDIIVVRGTASPLIGWFEKPPLFSTANKLIDHFDTAIAATCETPSVFFAQGAITLSCHNGGDISRYTFDSAAAAFRATKKRAAVVTNLGASGYSGTSATCSAVHPVSGHHLELFGKGHMIYDFDSDTLYDQNTVTFTGTHPCEPLSNDAVADCVFTDINGDDILDIVLATTSDNAARQGFFWFVGTSDTSFVAQGSFYPPDNSPPAKLIVQPMNNDPNKFDLIAVTTNCYSMYMGKDIMSYGLNSNIKLVPGQDGTCETCGCGVPGQILPYDWNNDSYVDLIAVVSGGAQLFMNQNGVFYFQTLLGGCNYFQLYNLDSDPTPDLICSDSGVAVWYSMGKPNSCAEGTHTCEQNCTDYNWAGFSCSCWDNPNNEQRWIIDQDRLLNESRVYCIDFDECANLQPDGTPYCLFGCNNTQGWYQCSCENSYGFRILAGGDCQDINECTETIPGFNPGCRTAVSSCENTKGGYKCSCNPGYQPDPSVANPNSNLGYNNTINCVDIDECENNRLARLNDSSVPALCSQICVNTVGGYNCQCNKGFFGARVCEPVICELDAWSQWSPTCDCGIVQKRKRNEKFVDGACGAPEKEETVSSMCNSTDFCSPRDGPPTSVAAADEIIDKFMSDDTISLMWPGWRRRLDTKRAHQAGIYYYDSDNCTAQSAYDTSQSMAANIASILTLPQSKILTATKPDSSIRPIPTVYDENCTITVDFSGAYPFDFLPVIISLAVGVPLILALIAYAYFWFAKKALDAKLEVLMNLPPAITRHYRECIMNPEDGWERLDNEPVLFRKLLEKKKDIEWVEHIFHILDGGSIKYNSIYAVFNPSLVNQMGLTWEKFENRVATNPQMFYAEKWQHDEKCTQTLLKQRQWVKSVFVNRVASFAWNQALSVPIIPTIHGTSASVAWKVCQSGFATLSALDIGFFGAGIYFTTSAKYAVPYFATKPNPAIIISYLVPGNPYPVTEDPNGPNSLAGQAVKPGYQCNYVLTTNRGMPFPQIEKKHIFDEIVIRQETQVAPAYVLMLDPRSFPALIKAFERMTAEDDPANFQQDD